MHQVSNAIIKIASIGGVTAAILFRRNLDAEYALGASLGLVPDPIGIPESAAEWISVMGNHPMIGLLYLNFFDLINIILVGLFFSGLLLALYKTGKIKVLFAGFLTLVSVGLYVGTNQSINVLRFSNQYFSGDPASRVFILAGLEKVIHLHRWNSFSGLGLYPSFLLVSLAGLIISFVMAKSDLFSKISTWSGILANMIGLGYYIFLCFLPQFSFIPLSISAVFLLAWYLSAGFQLWKIHPSIYIE